MNGREIENRQTDGHMGERMDGLMGEWMEDGWVYDGLAVDKQMGNSQIRDSRWADGEEMDEGVEEPVSAHHMLLCRPLLLYPAKNDYMDSGSSPYHTAGV